MRTDTAYKQHILISTGEASVLELGGQGAQRSSGLACRGPWGSPYDPSNLNLAGQEEERIEAFQAQVRCGVDTRDKISK